MEDYNGLNIDHLEYLFIYMYNWKCQNVLFKKSSRHEYAVIGYSYIRYFQLKVNN